MARRALFGKSLDNSLAYAHAADAAAGGANTVLRGTNLRGSVKATFENRKEAIHSRISKLEESGGRETSRFPTRSIDSSKDADILNRVSEIKGTLSNRVLNKSGSNMGYAEVNIEGINKNEFYAHSQVKDAGENPNLEGFSPKPKTPKYEAQEAKNADGVSYLRDQDSEYKIINDVASRLGGNHDAKGKIKLFTEKDTCDSCNSIISQFKKDYPDIEIEVIHNDGKPIPPKK
ncbi:deaminase domain-containing protein [Bacillus sp. FJAT-51639]|uniref:Deaminase domain-containing protein n=1 Tax=Bacillus bruguierae TaxID=3127667 RepID=A0ABU8FP19_9BACI